MLIRITFTIFFLILKLTVQNNREKEKNRYERFLGKDVVYTEYSFEEFADNPKKIIDLAK